MPVPVPDPDQPSFLKCKIKVNQFQLQKHSADLGAPVLEEHVRHVKSANKSNYRILSTFTLILIMRICDKTLDSPS